MPPVVERPRTEAELVAIVKAAARAGRPVAVGGPGRRPGGVTIDLSEYGRLVRVNRDNGEAVAQAGIALRTLGVGLGSWGLSMENGGDDPARALGAAVSLGVHGTGAGYGGVATQITALRLVTPDGAVASCSADEEPDLFDAARVGLDALGVISTLTVRCQPGFNLRVRSQVVDLDRALADFDEWAENNDHFELSWWPGRHQARVTTANRTEDPADGGAVDRGYRWFNRRRWQYGRRPVEFSFARCDAGPVLRAAADRSVISSFLRPGAGQGPSRLRPHRRDDGPRWATPFPIVVSVTAGDDIPLSPAQGRPSVYIAGAAGLDGRPQWGTVPTAAAASVRAWYPRFAEWEAVRDRLDPDRRFCQTSGHG